MQRTDIGYCKYFPVYDKSNWYREKNHPHRGGTNKQGFNVKGHDYIHDQSCGDCPQNIMYKLCIKPSIDVTSSKTMDAEIGIFLLLYFHQFRVQVYFPICNEIFLLLVTVPHVAVSGVVEFNWASCLKDESGHFGFSVVDVELLRE